MPISRVLSDYGLQLPQVAFHLGGSHFIEPRAIFKATPHSLQKLRGWCPCPYQFVSYPFQDCM